MLTIDLQENKQSDPVCLSLEQLDELIRVQDALGINLRIEPMLGSKSEYRLTPGSVIGAFETANSSVFIKPKITIKQLVSLLCYTIGQVKFQDDEFNFPEETALPDALALAFVKAAWKCFSRGLLHGYREREEALYAVRGRIMFDAQVRRRSGVLLPIEVRYDEFTDDILLNRLVKAAAWRLHSLLLTPDASRQLAQVMGMLDDVEYVEFSRHAVPEVKFDHLNEHYRVVVTLAQIILSYGAFEAKRGTVRASGFVVDMALVFQEFVTVALRNSLNIAEHEKFGEHHINSLDSKGSVKLKPDLTWWKGDHCQFVGDVKYKTEVPNADLYQLLAYVTALDLPGGLLVYAEGEANTYDVRHSEKCLMVKALDLSGGLEQVLSKVDSIATSIKCLYAAVDDIGSKLTELSISSTHSH